MATQPDASGGLKGFLPELLDTITGGIKLVAAGELQKKYPGFSFGADNNLAVNAAGQVKPAAAPAKDATLGDKVGSALRNPIVLTALVVVGALVVAKLVRS